MRALRFAAFGGPDALAWTSADAPEVGDDDLLVRPLATALNPVDLTILSGEAPTLITGRPPRGLGLELAGIVEAVGADVTRFAPGDRVLALLPTFEGEAHAERVAVPAADATTWPAALAAPEAGALPLALVTAWEGLTEKGGLRSGHRVLVNGASGSVGTVAVQLAVALGAEVVGTASARHRDLVASLGATPMDYHEADPFAPETPYDVVFDVAGKSSYSAAEPALRASGTYVTTLVTPGTMAAAAAHALLPGPSMGVCQAGPDGPALDRLVAYVRSGAIRPIVGETFAAGDAAEAYRALAAGPEAAGKAVLLHDGA